MMIFALGSKIVNCLRNIYEFNKAQLLWFILCSKILFMVKIKYISNILIIIKDWYFLTMVKKILYHFNINKFLHTN